MKVSFKIFIFVEVLLFLLLTNVGVVSATNETNISIKLWKKDTIITINANSLTVNLGKYVKFYGYLKDKDGNPVKYRKVEVYDDDIVGDDFLCSDYTDERGYWECTWRANKDPLDYGEGTDIEVKAKFKGDDKYDGCESGTVRVKINLPPDPPKLKEPRDGETVYTLTPTFSWKFSDPNNGDYQKAFQLRIWEAPGPNQRGTKIIFDKIYYSSAKSVRPSLNEYKEKLKPGRWYHWHVRAMDNHGMWSPWAADSPSKYMDFYVKLKTKLTINVDRTSVREGKPIRIYGRLVDSYGNGVPYRTIYLYDSDYGRDDEIICEECRCNAVKTDSNGYWSCIWIAKKMDLDWSVEIYAKFKGDNAYDGCESNQIKVIVIQNKPPTKPTISGPSSGYIGNSYTFTFKSSDPNGDKIKYVINWGDGRTEETGYVSSGSSVSRSHSWSSAGKYTVKIKACDVDGLCSDWASKTIKINKIPTKLIIYANPTKVCPGQVVKVYGWLKDLYGNPIRDKRVEIYESDTVTFDDFLCSDNTDSKGYWECTFKANKDDDTTRKKLEIYAKFSGDGKYEGDTSNTVYVYLKTPIKLTAYDKEGYVNENIKLECKLEEAESLRYDIPGKVVYFYLSNGKNLGSATTDSDGKAYIFKKFTSSGTYYYYCEFKGDSDYCPSKSNTAKIVVKPQPKPDLTVNYVKVPSSAYPNDRIDVKFEVKNVGNANVGYFKVGIYMSKIKGRKDWKWYYDVSGLPARSSKTITKQITIPCVSPGIYYITVEVDPDHRISESNENNNINYNTIKIEKISTKLKAYDKSGYVNSKIRLECSLKENKILGKGIPGKIVKFYVNGKYAGQSTTDSNGKAYLAKVFNSKGSYTYYCKFEGDCRYESSTSNTVKITVKGIPTQITINADKTSAYVGESVKFYGKLTDVNGNPISNARVYVYDSDTVSEPETLCSAETKDDGTWSCIWIANEDPIKDEDRLDKTVDARAKFDGNNIYDSCKSERCIEVKVKGKVKTNLEVLSISKDRVRVGDQVIIVGKLTDKSGNPIPNAIVKLYDSDPDFDDYIGSTTTNANGVWTFTWIASWIDPDIDGDGAIGVELYAKFNGNNKYSDAESKKVNISICKVYRTTAVLTWYPTYPTAGEKVTFDASYTFGNITKLEWNFGDGSKVVTYNKYEIVTHKYAHPGEYDVTLTVWDDKGNKDTSNRTIYVISSLDGDDDSDGIPNGEEIKYGTNPRVVDSDGDGLSDAIEIKLAKSYIPVLKLSKEESFYPTKIENFLNMSILTVHRSLDLPDVVINFDPIILNYNILKYLEGYESGKKNTFKLDFKEKNELLGHNPAEFIDIFNKMMDMKWHKNTTYVKIRSISYGLHNIISIQYWFFYIFNNYPPSNIPDFPDTDILDYHEGDWEHITIYVENETGYNIPLMVTYNQHILKPKILPWIDISKDQARVCTYVALGSHANYPSPGISLKPPDIHKGDGTTIRDMYVVLFESSEWFRLSKELMDNSEELLWGEDIIFFGAVKVKGPIKDPQEELNEAIEDKKLPVAKFEYTSYKDGIIKLDASTSYDPEGQKLRYVWYIDGEEKGRDKTLSITLLPGQHVITLVVIDEDNIVDFTSKTITVSQPEQIISLNIEPKQVILHLNDVIEFKAIAVYTNGKTEDVTSKAEWSSNSPNVVKYIGKGKFKAVGIGSATITAKYMNKLDTARVIVENRKPTIKLIYPPNGATISGDSVTLRWDGNDPDGDRLTYDIYLGTSKDLQLIVTDLTEECYTVSVSIGKTYYWEVVAKDEHGAKAESSIWSFTVEEKTYRVTIKTKGLNCSYSANLKIDGEVIGVINDCNPIIYEFKNGTKHTIEVDRFVYDNLDNLTRYHCANNQVIVSSETTVQFNYIQQHKLVVNVNPSEAGRVELSSLKDWYDKGEIVEIRAIPNDKYTFKSWLICPQGYRCVISDKNPETIQINVPTTITAYFAINITQYGVKLICKDFHHVMTDPINGTVYNITVVNTGNIRDTVILEVYPEITEGFIIGILVPDKVTIDPGESKSVKLIVKGNEYTKPGTYVIDVTATSQGDPSVRDTIKVITTVIKAELQIIYPTKQKPENAGYYKNPHDINVIVRIFVQGLNPPIHIMTTNNNSKIKLPGVKAFKVYIGNKEARVKEVIPIPSPTTKNPIPPENGGYYKLIVKPPIQDKSGYCDLKVMLYLFFPEWNTSYNNIGGNVNINLTNEFKIVILSDVEDDAVYYTSAPSIPELNGTIIIPDKTVMIWNGNYTIPIMIANVKDVIGLDIVITFDPTLIEITSIKTNSSLNNSKIYYNVKNGSVRAVLINMDGITAIKPSGIMDIVFKTLRTGFTHINITYAEFSDENFRPFNPSLVINGSIKITIKGDFNSNGRIDIGDVCYVAYIVVGKLPQDPRADFNNNGRVDIGDLVKIAYFLLGKIREL